jgi:hypothetical protein
LRKERAVALLHQSGLVETNSASWWFWIGRRIENLHHLAQDLNDRSFVDVQSSG